MGDLELSEFWRDRPTLVTGAAGLLGGWTIQKLTSEGAAVVGVDIEWDRNGSLRDSGDIRAVDADVRDLDRMRDLIDSEHIDIVIHLAAQTLVEPAVANPVDTFDHNIRGTWSLLEACRTASHPPKIVAASSDKAYGDAAGEPYAEAMPLRAIHPYDVSKACGDLIARGYARTYRLPVAVSRCGNLYGGGDVNWSRVVPGTVRSIVLGEAPVIRSDGTYIRDYLYVEDAATGLILLAQHLSNDESLYGTAFNFAAEERLSVIEIVRLILAAMDSDLEPVILNSVKHEIPEQRVEAARARQILGWKPEYAIDEGLQKTIEWYRSFFAK